MTPDTRYVLVGIIISVACLVVYKLYHDYEGFKHMGSTVCDPNKELCNTQHKMLPCQSSKRLATTQYAECVNKQVDFSDVYPAGIPPQAYFEQGYPDQVYHNFPALHNLFYSTA